MFDSLPLFSLFLYGAIVPLAADLQVRPFGLYVFDWRSPPEVMEACDE